jgi:hypothetical protein
LPGAIDAEASVRGDQRHDPGFGFGATILRLGSLSASTSTDVDGWVMLFHDDEGALLQTSPSRKRRFRHREALTPRRSP